MSVSSWDDGSVLDCAVQGPSSAAEFCAGWEGWLEGARLAQLASDEEDAVRVAVLCAGQNGFLVVAEEGDFRLALSRHSGFLVPCFAQESFLCLKVSFSTKI